MVQKSPTTGPLENISGKLDTPAHSMEFQSGILKTLIITDKIGRILKKKEALGNASNEYQYKYDEDGRLATVKLNGSTIESYTYDKNGRRTLETNTRRGIYNRKYYYGAKGKLEHADKTLFKYDHSGRLIKKANEKQKKIFQYNERGLLSGVHISHPFHRGHPESFYYTYDAKGRRTGISTDGMRIATFEWDGFRLKRMMDGSWWTFDYENDCVLPTSFTKDDEQYFTAYDQVGSLRAVTNEYRQLISETLYDSFGNILYCSNPNFGLPFGFAGGIKDENTNLQYYHYRDYDSDVARWATKDPLGYAAGDKDLYGYCLDDPINLIDFTGTNPTAGDVIWSGVAGLVSGAIRGGAAGAAGGITAIPGAIVGGIAGLTAGLLGGLAKGAFSPEDKINGYLNGEHKGQQNNNGNQLNEKSKSK